MTLREAGAGSPEIARARAGVARRSLGPFTQERTIGILAAKVRSTGTLTLVRPDRLRWELAPPDDVVYWVTPEGLAYKSPTRQGQGPRERQPAVKIAAALDDLRTLLGGDLGALRAPLRPRPAPRRADGRVAFQRRPQGGHGLELVPGDSLRPGAGRLVSSHQAARRPSWKGRATGPRSQFRRPPSNVAVEPSRDGSTPVRCRPGTSSWPEVPAGVEVRPRRRHRAMSLQGPLLICTGIAESPRHGTRERHGPSRARSAAGTAST